MHSLLLALALSILGPYSASSNFAANLEGTRDTRPGTWGTTETAVWHFTFKPPAGYRVRILRLQGDLVAWPKILPGDSPVEPGLVSGILLAFATTAPAGSVRSDWGADNTMLYIQDSVGGNSEKTRAPFNYRTNSLLEADNILVITVASWLNATGKPIHIEPTFTVTYQFERLT